MRSVAGDTLSPSQHSRHLPDVDAYENADERNCALETHQDQKHDPCADARKIVRQFFESLFSIEYRDIQRRSQIKIGKSSGNNRLSQTEHYPAPAIPGWSISWMVGRWRVPIHRQQTVAATCSYSMESLLRRFDAVSIESASLDWMIRCSVSFEENISDIHQTA